ncbi:GHKL domain-containing protein [Limosilactobacillus reuteri]|uniref:GHKL domain-containing protein n=1 Tax=Limosilactobacillus reuteri TaxID=1598 RepID=UPI001C56A4A2|nr:GHKL domain-containing protein [Limosilactobacillus reuteri]MBW3349387.1 GHKL domain-containing protein [Limosilactobacillus reuteri]UUW68143.1 GHKL domain-containing protein [Limosilactobacillus reuteri]
MSSIWFRILWTAEMRKLIPLSMEHYILIVFAFTILYILAIYVPTKLLQNKATIQNQQLELVNLSQYTSHIETMYDELRRFRHDYKNILLSLNDAVENRNIDQVSDIFKRVVIPTNVNVEARTSVLGKLAEVKNLEIKSLIYSKTMEAIDKGIKVEIEIEKPIKLDTNIQITDMLRIISILFDNAINATLNAKQPQINLSMFEEKNVQIFQIGNSTKEEHINLSKLSGRFNGVLTNSHHGLGLRNLRSILARYPFIQNNRSSKDYWFEQQIVIYKVTHVKK